MATLRFGGRGGKPERRVRLADLPIDRGRQFSVSCEIISVYCLDPMFESCAFVYFAYDHFGGGPFFSRRPLRRKSALAEDRFGRVPLRPRTVSAADFFGRGPLRERIVSAEDRFGRGPLRQGTAKEQPWSSRGGPGAAREQPGAAREHPEPATSSQWQR